MPTGSQQHFASLYKLEPQNALERRGIFIVLSSPIHNHGITLRLIVPLRFHHLLCINFEHFITFISKMVSTAILNGILKVYFKLDFLSVTGL